MKRAVLLATILIFLFNTGHAQNQSEANKISDEKRMEWWTDARLGMFIHWGIYSVPAGFYKGEATPKSAEWIMNRGKIPLAEYEKFADLFNPKSNFEIKATGSYKITFRPVLGAWKAVNLKDVVMTPVK